MSDKSIKVFRSDELKDTDTITMSDGTSRQFGLSDRNDTDQEFILLYMYVLPKFPEHGVKVGMTKCRLGETFWHAIHSRIFKQVNELALSQDWYDKYGYDREVVYWGICLDANNDLFKDYAVHDKIKLKFSGPVEKDQEWFTGVPIDDLITAFDECRQVGVNQEIYEPRREQRECVDALLKYFKDKPTGGRFLLNCKMRFGKSYTTYKYCEEANLNKILILTFVPAVESSWGEDLTHIKKHYNYYKDINLKKDSFTLTDKTEPFVVFLSLQNYLGKERNSAETKAKITKLQNVDWDLVVLDEYHFGAWNEKTQGTLESQEDFESEYQKELKKTGGDVINAFKINTKQTICLSGTPFKALAIGEFNSTNTYTYSYFDEQRNKYPNSDDDNFNILSSDNEVNPKYAQFPDMRIFGYNMSSLFSAGTVSLFREKYKNGRDFFSLNKFFKTRNDSNPDAPHEFVNEEIVKQWLDIIKGKSQFGDKFPYCNSDINQENTHTLWLLPSRSATNAMTKLLENDDYFKKYQIINLSADGVGSGGNALDHLNEGIEAVEKTNKLGSIALTVNKLTLGVTVKPWSSVLVLKDLTSAEQYFQSIFRIQTPYVEHGKIKKKYGNVYDFNIDRAASLMMEYATQASNQEKSERLNVAKLIVKYMPIFINGDFYHPIGSDVFYELAEVGDSSGKSLSKKITDTRVTTRILDEKLVGEMMSDPEISDIIKRVFAHAKFKKTITTTMPPEPDNDGFKTPEGKDGIDKGYELGKKDCKKYLDYDSNETQKTFDEAINEYFKTLQPPYENEKKGVWWRNGFIKGYERGVNAPIKKLQCGKDDGKKFAAVLKKKYGDNLVWNNDTKAKLTNDINSHLNANVPEQYRGMIYRRWYCDSFKQAVKNELMPKQDCKKGESIEDVDNTLKHILSRLFAFLYISVYRETTFEEIFNNADPNIFLEAVGITKREFEAINKYKIFQENVLNNYIHEFFVNESLGSTLDLNDEKVKKQYRNSFDWFGYGLE